MFHLIFDSFIQAHLEYTPHKNENTLERILKKSIKSVQELEFEPYEERFNPLNLCHLTFLDPRSDLSVVCNILNIPWNPLK